MMASFQEVIDEKFKNQIFGNHKNVENENKKNLSSFCIDCPTSIVVLVFQI